jgi:hypothetical protein
MTWTRTLVHDEDGAVDLQTCDLYAHRCAVLNWHHVCPESWFRAAGQPVGTPMRALCPNCHMNVHAAIDALISGHGVEHIPPRCVALARQALVLAEQNHLTPAPTL